MGRRMFGLIRKKTPPRVPLAERHKAIAIEAFLESKQRVRAIRKVRATSIQQTGATTAHIERVLKQAIDSRVKRLATLRRVLNKEKPKAREKN
ncbi:MAG: hypothetical protein WCW44_03545 [archaeon]